MLHFIFLKIGGTKFPKKVSTEETSALEVPQRKQARKKHLCVCLAGKRKTFALVMNAFGKGFRF